MSALGHTGLLLVNIVGSHICACDNNHRIRPCDGNHRVHLHSTRALCLPTGNVSNLILVPFISTDSPQVHSRYTESTYSNRSFGQVFGASRLRAFGKRIPQPSL